MNPVETVCTPSLQVELILFHIGKHLLRHEMPDIAAFFDALADERKTNYKRPVFTLPPLWFWKRFKFLRLKL